MKKKLILLAGLLFAIATVATTVMGSRSNDDMSLLMQNVEALAQREDLGESKWDVYQRPDGTGSNCIEPGSEPCK